MLQQILIVFLFALFDYTCYTSLMTVTHKYRFPHNGFPGLFRCLVWIGCGHGPAKPKNFIIFWVRPSGMKHLNFKTQSSCGM